VLVPSTVEVVQPIDESNDFPNRFTRIFETRRLENHRYAFVLQKLGKTMYHTMYMNLNLLGWPQGTPRDSGNFVILVQPSPARSNAGAFGHQLPIARQGSVRKAQTCIIPPT
jgi:hypothetical protein